MRPAGRWSSLDSSQNFTGAARLSDRADGFIGTDGVGDREQQL